MNQYEIEMLVWKEGVVNDKITVYVKAKTEEEALGKFLKVNTQYYIKLENVRLYKKED